MLLSIVTKLFFSVSERLRFKQLLITLLGAKQLRPNVIFGECLRAGQLGVVEVLLGLLGRRIPACL